MGYPVFISYARQASREHAEALHHALGPDLAYLDSEELRFGKQFSAALVDALFAARVVVVLAEPVYFTRWYCLLEFRVARTPFLRAIEQPESTQAEQDDALRGIVIALPQGSPDAVLERLPPLLRVANWPTIDDPEAIARLVSERLTASLPTLAERYQALGEADATREMLLEAMRLPSPQRIGKIPSVPQVGLPASLHERFVGRADELWRIHDVLTTSSGEPAATSLAGSIEAGGGFGKTRLALEYLYRFGTRHFRGGLFWIDAGQDVESQHYEVVKALDPSAPDVAALRAGQGGVAGALARVVRSRDDGEPLIFVIDNVPEPEAGTPPLPLSHWCPLIGEVAVLATSRRQVALGGAGSIVAVQIDTLDPDAAVRLLTMGVRREPLSEPVWLQVAEWVGHLPLALELLNGLLISGAMEAGELLRMSREQRTTAALDSAMDALRGAVPQGALRGITEAFAASYASLTDAEQYAARLIAWMSPALVPDSVLDAVESDPFTPLVRATLRERYLVIAPDDSDPPVAPTMFGSMHAVVADFLRSRSGRPPTRIPWWGAVFPGLSGSRDPRLRAYGEADIVLRALRRVTEGGDGDERLRRVSAIGAATRAITEHAFASAEAWGGSARRLTAIASDVSALFVSFMEVGAYGWAQTSTETSVRYLSRLLGKEHRHTLTSMNNLASSMAERGNHAGALAIEERVLTARRRRLGEKHPDTISSLNSVALSLRERGDLAGAQAMLERAVRLSRQVRGEEHPRTLATMSSLALTLKMRGDLAGAQQITQGVLAAMLRVQGEEHPDTLTTADYLAEFLYARGDLAGAQELLERVLAARSRVLGEEHPRTLGTLNNLAQTLTARGDKAGALRIQEQLTETLARVLGEEHPHTLTAWSNLADTLRMCGDHQAAEEIQERVLAVRRRVLGADHPDTLNASNNLAATFSATGDHARAQAVFTEVLAGLRRVLGEDHPHTIIARENLAEALKAQGNHLGLRAPD